MKITNSLNLPEFIFEALCDAYLSHSEPEENEISTTTLNKPDGMIVIDRNHKDEIVVDVQDIASSAIGTILHAYLEKYAKKHGLMAEETLTRLVGVNGKVYKVTGRFDFYDPRTYELFDFKATKVATYDKNRDGRDNDWYKQGASYANGLEEKGYPVKKFTNVCALLDYSAMKNNASGLLQMISHDLTTPEAREFIAETLDYQDKKVVSFDELRNLDESKLPMCNPEERWEDQSWAVMKDGRKSAVRCFATEEEAKDFLNTIDKDKDKHYIEKRGGNPKRCLYYCSCREFCPYYRSEVLKGEEV